MPTPGGGGSGGRGSPACPRCFKIRSARPFLLRVVCSRGLLHRSRGGARLASARLRVAGSGKRELRLGRGARASRLGLARDFTMSTRVARVRNKLCTAQKAGRAGSLPERHPACGRVVDLSKFEFARTHHERRGPPTAPAAKVIQQ
jgi:hypothetical protein